MTLELNALCSQWRGRERFVLLLAGAGASEAFLRTWQAWRDDARRPSQLEVIVIDSSPRAGAPDAPTPLALALAAVWPPHTRNLHRLAFDGDRLRLLLAFGTPRHWLSELQANVHAFVIGDLDLSSDPTQGPQRLAKALARLAAPLARLRCPILVDQALRSAGFDVAGDSGDTRCVDAVYAPRFVPRGAPPPVAPTGERRALIVGAGLAGCALACALAEQGWHSILFDRCAAPAQEASGNPAGLFHGVVHAQEGAHTRFNRAAALQAHLAVQRAIGEHGAQGSTHGLLRLETAADLPGMHALLARLRLPDSYVQAMSAAEAGARCGLPLAHPAWFYPGGGWVQPAALARSFLQRAGVLVQFRGGATVQRLRRADGAWQLLDAAGRVIDQAATLVLANAADLQRLLGVPHWPLHAVRGQISQCNTDDTPGTTWPRLPVAGAGYVLPPIDGVAIFGASAQADDLDASVRDIDHAFNLRRLRQLCPQLLPNAPALQGRVGWRLVADDRLPLLGGAPDEVAMAHQRFERARGVPRRDGLYIFGALGSRGITWAALSAQVLAAQISGAALPLEASLAQSLDPARFALRASRRRTNQAG